uniref:Uncharacterized protein n=1 Tax=Sphenodon punctatus TaxID=8508 RepID=A0A8D0H350_SPHPU
MLPGCPLWPCRADRPHLQSSPVNWVEKAAACYALRAVPGFNPSKPSRCKPHARRAAAAAWGSPVTFFLSIPETAVNIGYSCNMLYDAMKEIFVIAGHTSDDVLRELRDARRKMKPDSFSESDESNVQVENPNSSRVLPEEQANGEYALVINGHSLPPTLEWGSAGRRGCRPYSPATSPSPSSATCSACSWSTAAGPTSGCASSSATSSTRTLPSRSFTSGMDSSLASPHRLCTTSGSSLFTTWCTPPCRCWG